MKNARKNSQEQYEKRSSSTQQVQQSSDSIQENKPKLKEVEA